MITVVVNDLSGLPVWLGLGPGSIISPVAETEPGETETVFDPERSRTWRFLIRTAGGPEVIRTQSTFVGTCAEVKAFLVWLDIELTPGASETGDVDELITRYRLAEERLAGARRGKVIEA